MTHEGPSIRELRCYVDGELDAADRAAMDQRVASSPALQQQVEFEQRLRAHVRQVMNTATPTAPPGLAERVRSTLRDDVAAVAGRIDPQTASDDSGERSRWTRWLAGPRRANLAAVAASLALVAGAVLWGIYGPPIDAVRPDVDRVAEAANYIAREHTRCAVDEIARSQKVAIADQLEMRQSFLSYLGVEPVVPHLESLGYELQGGGRCEVPGEGKSVHMLYRRPRSEGRPPAMVSLFVVPNLGQLDHLVGTDLPPGAWFEMPMEPKAPHRVDCTTDGALLYFLVCCDADDLRPVAGLVSGAIDDRLRRLTRP